MTGPELQRLPRGRGLQRAAEGGPEMVALNCFRGLSILALWLSMVGGKERVTWVEEVDSQRFYTVHFANPILSL